MIGITVLFATAFAAPNAELTVDGADAGCSDVTGAPYCTIQAAVNDAAANDSVRVAPGTYNENVTIDKNLTLTSTGAVIDGAGATAVAINGSGITVIVDGFHLTNGQNGLATAGDLTLTFANSTVSNNSNTGIYIGGSSAALYNLTVSGNGSVSGFQSGGLYNDTGDVTLNNVTFTGNVNTAVYVFSFGGTATLTVSNSIIDGGCSISGGTFTSLGYNIGSAGSCPLVAVGDSMMTNPLLGPLQDNGGPTPTHALQSTSPALNAGSPETPGSSATACELTDQRGLSRPQGSTCDIGALELGAALSIEKSGITASPPAAPITYTLTVVNNGIVDATNLTITDVLPTGATYVQGGTYSVNDNTVSWTLSLLPASSAISRQFVVTATNTIVNDTYAVSADNAFTAVGATAVTTLIQEDMNWTLYDAAKPGNSIFMLAADDGWMLDYGGTTATIYRWNGTTWQSTGTVSHTQDIVRGDIHMVSANDGWIVLGGPLGEPASSVIYRWNGSSWTQFTTITDLNEASLSALDMVTANDGWAVQSGAFWDTFYRWNGSGWQKFGQSAIGTYPSNDIDMVSASDGWAVGLSGAIVRWNGSAWNSVTSPTSSTLNAVFMRTASDGWAVGRDGVILHWNGSAWTEMSSPVTAVLNDVYATAADDVWAIGRDGVILHWDGSSWTPAVSPVSGSHQSIAMVSDTDGWIVSFGGLLRYTPPTPSLAINYSSGAPGSYFTLTGANFPANATATITVNGQTLGTINTNGAGGIVFLLSTAAAETGIYEVTVSVNPSASAQFTLNATAPVRAKTGDGTIIAVPNGIAQKSSLFLPILLRK